MIRFRWTSVALVAGACLAATALAGSGAHAGDAPVPVPVPANAGAPMPALFASPADVARGKALFTGTCGAYCHRPVAGPGDAPFLFDCDWRHGGSDNEMFHSISHGVPGTRMLPFGGALEDADIWRLVAYLKSASQCRPANG